MMFTCLLPFCSFRDQGGQLQTQPVETLAGKAFQSHLHDIIQYIHNETLGQSSSNGLDVMVHTVTDLA
eukprot:scaffold248338_cov94-Cyclotella_meneghiniana.AAC.1